MARSAAGAMESPLKVHAVRAAASATSTREFTSTRVPPVRRERHHAPHQRAQFARAEIFLAHLNALDALRKGARHAIGQAASPPAAWRSVM